MRNIREFQQLVKDLLDKPIVQNMATMKQHSESISLLEHLIYTAYVTYCICDIFNLNKKEAVRGALLHDFRLEDSAEYKNNFSHSKMALQDAKKHFTLTEREQNIILSHMWPLNITLIPRSKEAFVVGLADTYCATMEYLKVLKLPRFVARLMPRTINSWS